MVKRHRTFATRSGNGIIKNSLCGNYSTFLFSKPTRWIGAGSIMNFAGSYYDFNYSISEREADFRAAFNDWCAVYNDLNISLKNITNSLEVVAEEDPSLVP